MDQLPQTPEGPPPVEQTGSLASQPPQPAELAKPPPEKDTDPIAPEEPPTATEPSSQLSKTSPHHRVRGWLKAHKKLSLLLGLLAVVAVLAAVPWTRYQAAGLVLKRTVTINVVDSVSGKPVSGATVSSDGQSTQTDGNGHASLRVKEGYRQLQVSLQYYQSASQKILVPILSPKKNPTVSLVATGRQVDVLINDLISQDPLAGATIKVAGITATTDKNGEANIVLPAGSSTQKATISLAGYNDATATIEVSNDSIQANNFNLVPAGKIYYLGDSSGTLDLMSANLDGKGSKVLLAGTDKEDNGSAIMYVSPDNRYVALETNRDGGEALIYAVNTSDGSAKVIDTSSSSYNMYGWLGDKLVYSALSSTVRSWQAGREKLKSYDAPTGKIVTLNQSQATGSVNESASENYVAVSILPTANQVAFVKSWIHDPGISLSAERATFNVVSPDGTNLTTIAKFPATDFIGLSQYTPTAYYVSDEDDASTTYYGWQIGTLSAAQVSLSASQFDKATAQTYFYSPDLKKTVWSEPRNGAKATFTGDANGANAKQVGGAKDFSSQTAFGWLNSSYALTHIPGGCNLEVIATNGKDSGVIPVSNCISSGSNYNFD